MWLWYLLLASVSVQVAYAGPIACPNNPSIQGYTNKTILNEDIVKFKGDGTDATTTYILCPGTTFRYTTEDQESLYLHHANTILQCGADGSSANNCLLQLAGSTVRELLVVFGNNTLVQGLTFTQDNDGTTIDFQSGVVNVYNTSVFRDCHFQNFIVGSNEGKPMIRADTLSERQEPPDTKSLALEGCTFRNNANWFHILQIFQKDNQKYDVTIHETVVDQTPTEGFAVVANRIGGSLSVTNSVFRCAAQVQPQAIIQAQQGAIKIDSSCFVEMNVAEAYAIAFGDNAEASTQNTAYVNPPIRNTPTECSGIQVTTFQDNKSTKTCFGFDTANACPLQGQDASPCPTPMPTAAPTAGTNPPSGAQSVGLTMTTILVSVCSFVLLFLLS